MNQEILKLKERIRQGRQKAKNQGKRIPFWPKELKLEIIAFLNQSQIPLKELAYLIDVSPVSLNCWSQGKGLSTHRTWQKSSEKSEGKELIVEERSFANKELLPSKEDISENTVKRSLEEDSIASTPAFLTFEVMKSSSSMHSQGELGAVRKKEEDINQHRSNIEAILPTGVRLLIPPDSPNIDRFFKIFMGY